MIGDSLKSNIKKRIFIVGCPRSGTTLLQSIFLTHKDIISFPETHLFTIIKYNSKMIFKNLFNTYYIIKKFFNINKKGYNFKYPFIPLDLKNAYNFIFEQFDNITLENKKNIWLEKTPFHLYSIEEINSISPDEVVFLHLIRNPLDTIASLYDATNNFKSAWSNLNIDETIERYKKDFNITKQYINKNNHYLVIYENLSDCEYIENLFNILDISPEYNLNNVGKASKSIILDNEPWKNKNTQNISIDKSHPKFKKVFTQDEQSYVLNKVQGLMLEYEKTILNNKLLGIN